MDSSSPGIKYGIYGGIAISILTLFIYFISEESLFSLAPSLLGFLVYIVAMVMAVRDKRTLQGDLISFGESFKEGLKVYLIAALIATITMALLFNLIDPDLQNLAKEMTLERLESARGLLGDEGVEAAIEGIESQGNPYSIQKLLLGYGVSAIFGVIISAIIGAIMKKNPQA